MFLFVVLVLFGILSQATTTPHPANYDSVTHLSRDEVPPPTRVLSSGVTAFNQRVETSEMMYYKTRALGGVQQTWWVNQTSSSYDCDIYIRFGEYPTRDYYSYSDTSTKTNFKVNVVFPETGETYAAVYGYGGPCQYSITVEGGIPICGDEAGSCSGNGECVDHACQCSPGFLGPFCEVEVQQVIPNSEEPYEGSVQPNQTVWFSYVADGTFDQIDWIFEERGGSCEIAWYYSAGDFVVLSTFITNQTNVMSGETYTIFISVPVEEEEDCLYSLNLNGVNWGSCENFCRYHGSCSETDSCKCETDYSGAQCEEYSPSLTLNTTMSGFVRQFDYNYYHLSVGDDIFSGAVAIVLTSTHRPGGFRNGDCDLLVRANGYPTHFEYDSSSYSLEQQHRVVLSEPRGKDWFIGVSGWSDCEYQLTAQCSCPPHKTCVVEGGFGGCICEEGWGGPDCMFPLTTISPNSLLSNLDLASCQWKYFLVEVENLRDFSLVLKTVANVTLLVEVSLGEIPSDQSNDIDSDYYYCDSDWDLVPSLAPYSDVIRGANSAKIRFALAEEESFTGNVYIGIKSGQSRVFGEAVVWVK